jgi:hypothetical protein
MLRDEVAIPAILAWTTKSSNPARKERLRAEG